MKKTERILEDWACANLRDLVGEPEPTLVGRQVRLPNGQVLDLLVAHFSPYRQLHLTVVELKRDRIEVPAVAQVLGYVGQVLAIRDVIAAHSKPRVGSMHVRGLLAAPAISPAAARCIEACGGALSYATIEIGKRPVAACTMPIVDAGEAAIERTAIEIAERLPPTPPPPAGRDVEWWEEIDLTDEPWLIEMLTGSVKVEPTWADLLADELF